MATFLLRILVISRFSASTKLFYWLTIFESSKYLSYNSIPLEFLKRVTRTLMLHRAHPSILTRRSMRAFETMRYFALDSLLCSESNYQ